MDERDLEAEHAVPRCLVDQLRAGVREMGERGPNVVHLVRDVVHSGTSVREEAADRSVVVERAEQLEPALSDADRRRLDALLLDTRALLELGPEKPLIGLERTVEILDGKPDVVDGMGRIHAADRM